MPWLRWMGAESARPPIPSDASAPAAWFEAAKSMALAHRVGERWKRHHPGRRHAGAAVPSAIPPAAIPPPSAGGPVFAHREPPKLEPWRSASVAGRDSLDAKPPFAKPRPATARFSLRKGALDEFERTVSFLTPGATSNRLEESLKRLGELLRFRGQRPDHQFRVGSDVLWLSGKNQGFLIECKHRKDGKNPLTKDEHGQLLISRQWAGDNYPERDFVGFIVHPASEATPSAAAEKTKVRCNTFPPWPRPSHYPIVDNGRRHPVLRDGPIPSSPLALI